MSYIQQASNAFLTIQVSISKWSGVSQLKQAASKAASAAGASEANTRMYFNMLGQHHSDLKQVNAMYSAVRTYLYANTLPFSQAEGEQQQRGDRLIAVSRVPDVVHQLGVLVDAANSAADSFVAEYERMVAASIAHDVGEFKSEINYPTADQVRSKFAARISAPQTINVADMSRFGSLPVAMANEINASNNRKLEAQLQCAKDAAIKEAEDLAERVANQMRSGKRFHDSLKSEAKRVASLLRDMVQGYDNDPRLLAMADLIDEQIGTIDIDRIREHEHARHAPRRAAETVSKGIKDMRKAGATNTQPVSNNDPVVGGGFFADLLS